MVSKLYCGITSRQHFVDAVCLLKDLLPMKGSAQYYAAFRNRKLRKSLELARSCCGHVQLLANTK
jgi:hypothetical protein